MDYWVGTDLLGDDPYVDYGPPSPQQLLEKANTEIAKMKGAGGAKPVSFLQKEAFGGLKVWQAGALGIGVIGILSGLGIALVRGK